MLFQAPELWLEASFISTDSATLSCCSLLQLKKDISSGTGPRLLTYLRKIRSYLQGVKTQTPLIKAHKRNLRVCKPKETEAALCWSLEHFFKRLKGISLPSTIIFKATLIRNLDRLETLAIILETWNQPSRFECNSPEIITYVFTQKFCK